MYNSTWFISCAFFLGSFFFFFFLGQFIYVVRLRDEEEKEVNDESIHLW